MIQKGTYCFAGNAERGSIYFVELLEDYRQGSMCNPLCKVLRVVKYPHQYALHGAYALYFNEPHGLGEHARLDLQFEVIKENELLHWLSVSYEESLHDALEVELHEQAQKLIVNEKVLNELKKRLVKPDK